MNAGAGPNGLIVVNRGIVEYAANEEEVTLVIAHEIGHQAANHVAAGQRNQAIGALAVILRSAPRTGGCRNAPDERREAPRALFRLERRRRIWHLPRGRESRCQIGERNRLPQETERTGHERARVGVAVCCACQEERRRAEPISDCAGGVYAITHPVELDIHEHDIRALLLRDGNGCLSGACPSDNLMPELDQHVFNEESEKHVILDDKEAQSPSMRCHVAPPCRAMSRSCILVVG